ncbi:unnamed protein product [Arabis nemorensis]|uniref:Uncharacterized protein n=1 Tax=Arabis nemorensis TaxID=586526 RepID=A0A565AT57_9BRAS|nr:unnamed protein product [Arabis nemorensis]
MEIGLDYEIDHDPEPDDVGTIRVTARIFGKSETFTASTPAKEFIDDEVCRSKEELNYFLIDAGVNDSDIFDVISKLIFRVDDITCSTSNEYSPECALEVKLDLFPDDLDDDQEGTQIEEAVQVSFDQTSNIRFRPANKLVSLRMEEDS